ncbi:MAG: HEAT repeat domain-containing protein, partial [Pirellulaceae bacterium]|nr:HEAT repeat domain-containing protein [Pirellulaceae bacterium]
MDQDLTPLLGESADPVAAGYHLHELADGGPANGLALLLQLGDQLDAVRKSDPAILGGILHLVHTLILRASGDEVASTLQSIDPALILQIEMALPEQTPNRHLLLHLLAMIRSQISLEILLAILMDRPPKQWVQAAQVLSPLMQHKDWPIDTVFPESLQCLIHPSLAAPLLDLANYLTRQQRVDEHPAAEQLQALNHLLGEVSHRLGSFEENPRAFGTDVDTVQNTLGEAVALAVSLCDAVGLIGDPSSIGKLNQTVELRHRRVQCEAAGALAKLGEESGRTRLIELASDPAARLRAIEYADEMGFGDRIDEQYRSDNATAEAELALWLSQPQQMGVPPTSIEVIDSRRMLWPSFHNPIDVFLIRFEYNFGDRNYSNVGMSGPTSHALAADVADLPVDDIYSIYAGWHAEHPDIFTVGAEQFNEAQLRTIEPLEQHLQHLGYDSIKPELLGFLLDEQAAVFSAVRDNTQCL